MVAKHGYDWSDLNRPPEIDAHSIAKHDVIRAYVERYVSVLTANPRIDVLRINFVDGFAGGGLYRNAGQLHLGSPLLLLQTIEQLQKKIRAERTKPFEIRSRYYFIEKDRKAHRALLHNLNGFGHDVNPDKGLHVERGNFVQLLPSILDAVQAAGGQKRTVFLLDQYGYKDVPFGSLKVIFATLPHAEVILTFATDALINYMSTRPEFLKAVQGIGLGEVLTPEYISTMHETREARFAVEKILHEHIHTNSGARFFTPFFVRSPNSHRSYWLVHLSSHPKARDEMTAIHWNLANHFCHYGKAGLNMLGFDPEMEDFGQSVFDFYFDDNAKRRTYDALSEDIPRRLKIDKPITYGQLFTENCNQTPAHSAQFKQVLFDLASMGVLQIRTPSGSLRRAPSAICADDVILLNRNFRLFPTRSLS